MSEDARQGRRDARLQRQRRAKRGPRGADGTRPSARAGVVNRRALPRRSRDGPTHLEEQVEDESLVWQGGRFGPDGRDRPGVRRACLAHVGVPWVVVAAVCFAVDGLRSGEGDLRPWEVVVEDLPRCPSAMWDEVDEGAD